MYALYTGDIPMHRGDVLHVLPGDFTPWLPRPVVVTAPDALPADPQAAAQLATACRMADWVVCPSMDTHDRLVRHYRADPDAISVIPWGPNPAIAHRDAQQTQRTLETRGIRGRFVWHRTDGSAEHHTAQLIEAWAILKPALRQTRHLVITGLDDHARHTLLQKAKSLGIVADLYLLPPIPEAEAHAFFQAASFVLHLDRLDTVGQCLIDALSAGTPSLVAQRPLFEELAGDAAVYVDPVDPCSIARGVSQLLRSQITLVSHIRAARRRAERFEWHRTAQRYAQTFELVRRYASRQSAAA